MIGVSAPIRIQISCARGWRMPPNTRKVDRSTKWGNPFGTTQIAHTFMQRLYPAPIVYFRLPPSLDRSIDLYLAWLAGRLTDDPKFLEPLRGLNLGCWCPLDQPCHADHLLRLANFNWSDL